MEPVRWGILGVSSHYVLRVHLPLAKSSMVEVYGIASRSADRAKKAALELGIPNSYPSYQELLQDKHIEAVYIPLPNHLHTKWVKKAADEGKHILCEKPLAMSTDEAQESVSYAQKKGVMLMEAFMYRFHPQWIRALELVKAGEIGEVRMIHTAFTFHLTDPHNIRNILDAGGGAVRDIGCYAASISRHLLQAEPHRVVSLVHRDPQLNTDILTSAILHFGTARSLFTVSTQTFPFQRVDIHGTGGNISIQVPFNMYPDVPAKLTVTTSIGTREVVLGPADQYGLEFEAFSSALRTKQPAPTPPEDAILNQKVLDAVFRSEQTGNWEPV